MQNNHLFALEVKTCLVLANAFTTLYSFRSNKFEQLHYCISVKPEVILGLLDL